MADYATKAEIQAFAQEPFALEDSTAWDTLTTAASRLFDNLVEVDDDFFNTAGATFTDRDFIGDGTAYLKLDPYTELDSTDPVLINEGTINDVDFDDNNLPEYVARNGMLVALDRTNQVYAGEWTYPNRFTGWPDGVQIRVSAKWGFTAVPKDVKVAVIQIALHMFRTQDAAFAEISGAEKVVPLALPPTAQKIIDNYREKYSRRFVIA